MKMIFIERMGNDSYSYIVLRKGDIPKCIHTFIKDAEQECIYMGGRYSNKKGQDALDILHWDYMIMSLDEYRETYRYDDYEWDEFINNKYNYFKF